MDDEFTKQEAIIVLVGCITLVIGLLVAIMILTFL